MVRWGAQTIRRLADQWDVSAKRVREIGENLDDATASKIAAHELSNQPSRAARAALDSNAAQRLADQPSRIVSRPVEEAKRGVQTTARSAAVGTVAVGGTGATIYGINSWKEVAEDKAKAEEVSQRAEDRAEQREVVRYIMENLESDDAAAALENLDTSGMFGQIEAGQGGGGLLGGNFPDLFSVQGVITVAVVILLAYGLSQRLADSGGGN